MIDKQKLSDDRQMGMTQQLGERTVAEPSPLKLKPREWLCSGGNGHEDGEDGIRAMTITGESLVEYLQEYREYLEGEAAAPQPSPTKDAKWCCDGKKAVGDDLHNPDCQYHFSNFKPSVATPSDTDKGGK